MQNRTCHECGKVYKPQSTKTNILCCSWSCYNAYRKGRPRKEARYSYGYRYLFLPDHPGSSKQGYLAEHRLVGEQKIGRRLTNKDVVHHINGIRDDNRPENIVVCTRQEHNKIDSEIVAGIKKRALSSKKPVSQIDDHGKEVKLWKSRTEAATHFGCSITSISQAVCKGYRSQGFFWR